MDKRTRLWIAVGARDLALASCIAAGWLLGVNYSVATADQSALKPLPWSLLVAWAVLSPLLMAASVNLPMATILDRPSLALSRRRMRALEESIGLPPLSSRAYGDRIAFSLVPLLGAVSAMVAATYAWHLGGTIPVVIFLLALLVLMVHFFLRIHPSLGHRERRMVQTLKMTMEPPLH